MSRRFVDLSIYLQQNEVRGGSAGWTRAVAIFDDALLPRGASA